MNFLKSFLNGDKSAEQAGMMASSCGSKQRDVMTVTGAEQNTTPKRGGCGCGGGECGCGNGGGCGCGR